MIESPPMSRDIDLKRVSLSRLRKLCNLRDKQGDDARSEMVERIVDLDLEYRDENMDWSRGWSGISPTLMIGEPLGGGIRGDQMETAYEKGIRSYGNHDWAHTIMETLPPRRRAALLISRRKRLPNRYDLSKDADSDIWCRGYKDIFSEIKQYCRMLKMKPEDISKCHYKDIESFKNAARQARTEILFALSA